MQLFMESFMVNFIKNFEANLSALLLAGMTIIITIQIIFRYFISYSLSWPEELGRFLFIAAVYIGASYAEKEDKHLAITILRTSAGKWCQRFIPIIAQTINVLFCILMTWWGYVMVEFMYNTNQLAPAVQISMYLVYIVIPLGFGCMSIRAIINLIKFFKNAFEEK